MDNGENSGPGADSKRHPPFHGAGPGRTAAPDLSKMECRGTRAPAAPAPSGRCCVLRRQRRRQRFRVRLVLLSLGISFMALHVADSNAILSASPRIPLRRSLAA